MLARLAAITIFAFAGLTAAASAAQPGYTTGSANLREGPGTSYDVIAVLSKYTSVVIEACTATWCAVTTEDDDEGFVSKSLLAFGSFDDDNEEEDEEIAEVCFYQQANLKGANFCVEAGDSDGDIPGNFDNNIESILITGGLEVEVCSGFNLGGDCYFYDATRKNLPGAIRNKITSYEVKGGGNVNDDDDDDDGNIIILQ
jgi:hypothetical protein